MSILIVEKICDFTNTTIIMRQYTSDMNSDN